MCTGEYESLKAIHATVPGFCPEPYAHGEYSSDPATHFLLVEFRNIGSQVSSMSPSTSAGKSNGINACLMLSKKHSRQKRGH